MDMISIDDINWWYETPSTSWDTQLSVQSLELAHPEKHLSRRNNKLCNAAHQYRFLSFEERRSLQLSAVLFSVPLASIVLMLTCFDSLHKKRQKYSYLGEA